MKARLLSPCVLVLFVGMCFTPGTAAPGTQDQAKIALHLQAINPEVDNPCLSGSDGGDAPTALPCSQFTTAGRTGVGYHVYLVVGNGYTDEFGTPGISGLSAGINYDYRLGRGVDVYGWTMCADGLDFPNVGAHGPWPAAGSGTRVTWLHEGCDGPILGAAGQHAIAGWFYVYAHGSDSFAVTENMPLLSGPELVVSDCPGTESHLPVTAAGRVDFSPEADAPGYTPCPDVYPPLCRVPHSVVDIGLTPLGSYRDGSISVENRGYPGNLPVEGTATIEGSASFTILGDPSVSAPSPGDIASITVRFTPARTGPDSCWLYPGSTCERIRVIARGAYLPKIAITPGALDAQVNQGEQVVQTLTVGNGASAALAWQSSIQYDTLEEILPALDANIGSVLAAIPNPYFFLQGVTGMDIDDPKFSGSGVGRFSTMFGHILYSNGSIVSFYEPDGPIRYFTRKYPGLFVLVADLNDYEGTFRVSGILYGNASRQVAVSDLVTVVDGVKYFGYSKRVWGSTNASVNQLVIVTGDPLAPYFDTSPLNLNQDMQASSPARRVIYLFFTSTEGTLVDEVTTVGVMRAFLEAAYPDAGWLSLAPPLGTVSAGTEQPVQVRWDATSLSGGEHQASLAIKSNDITNPDVRLPVLLHVVIPPPELILDCVGFEAAVLGGSSTVKPLSIRNGGPGTLHFRLATSADWLNPIPAEGTVAAGGCAEVAVGMGCETLADGDAETNLLLLSDDPNRPQVSIPVRLHVGTTAPAAALIGPESLNPGSKGRWVTAAVELPSGLDPGDVLVPSVRALGSVPTDSTASIPGDFNANGIPDWTFKFDRSAFVLALPPADSVQVRVVGEVRDQTWFLAEQPIRVLRPHLSSPNGGEKLLPGSWTTLSWTMPPGWHPDHVSVAYSADAGATWTSVADLLVEPHMSWQVPQTLTESGLIRVRAYDEDGIIGWDVSDHPFSITGEITGTPEEPIQRGFALDQNSPNPFRSATTIRFALPAESPVDLQVFDVTGRSVAVLRRESMPAGEHQSVWDGRDARGHRVAAGLYLYRLSADMGSVTRRMFILP